MAWAAIVPAERLIHLDWSLWLHVPLIGIVLGVLTISAAIGGIAAAEYGLRRRQAGASDEKPAA